MLFKIFKIIKNHMVCWTVGLQMAVEGVEHHQLFGTDMTLDAVGFVNSINYVV